MAAFAKSSFNAQLYSASRPTYPQQLFDFIFRYHEFGVDRLTDARKSRAQYVRAVDLGCGTGQATLSLLPFNEVIGVDPSRRMTQAARMYIDEELERQGKSSNMKKRFKFENGPAEELPFLENGSVDLVVAAQAAHWFDWNRLWPELARVLRSKGTVAVWGYSEMRFSRYPSLTPLIDAYTHGPDPATSLGPHWQQPGRSIVENLLQDIPSAQSIVGEKFYSERRIYFSGPHFPSIPNARAVVLHKKMSWENFEAYLRSFSSLNTFQAHNPDDFKHPDGDVVQRFMKTIKIAMREIDSSAASTGQADRPETVAETNEGEVEIEWPLALILAKKV